MTLKESPAFTCPDCGTTTPSTAVEYDALGYAVCPLCAHETGPIGDGIDASDGDRIGAT